MAEKKERDEVRQKFDLFETMLVASREALAEAEEELLELESIPETELCTARLFAWLIANKKRRIKQLKTKLTELTSRFLKVPIPRENENKAKEEEIANLQAELAAVERLPESASKGIYAEALKGLIKTLQAHIKNNTAIIECVVHGKEVLK